MILIVFVELFDMCMYAHCSVNCSKTFMLKVCLLYAHCSVNCSKTFMLKVCLLSVP